MGIDDVRSQFEKSVRMAETRKTLYSLVIFERCLHIALQELAPIGSCCELLG